MFKSTYGKVSLIVILGGILWGLLQFQSTVNGSHKNSNTSMSRITEKEIREIHLMGIEQGVPHKTSLKQKETLWYVSNDLKNFPADSTKVQRLIDILTGLQNTEVVSRNPERAKEYGLDSSVVKQVQVTLDKGTTWNVEIGKMSTVDYSSTFWRSRGQVEVYRTPGNFSFDVNTNEDYWKNKNLYPNNWLKRQEVESLEVTWKKENVEYSYKIIASPDTSLHPKVEWLILTDNENASSSTNRGNKGVIDGLVNRLSGLSIDSFPSVPQGFELLGPPVQAGIHITIKLRDGSKSSIVAVQKDNGYWVKYPMGNDIVQINGWRLKIFEKALIDLIAQDDIVENKE